MLLNIIPRALLICMYDDVINDTNTIKRGSFQFFALNEIPKFFKIIFNFMNKKNFINDIIIFRFFGPIIHLNGLCLYIIYFIVHKIFR